MGGVGAVTRNRLLLDDYFALPAPKSTGREYFNINWLSNALADYFPSSAELQSEEKNNNLALKTCKLPYFR